MTAQIFKEDSNELRLIGVLGGSGWDCEFGGIEGGSSIGVVVPDDAIAGGFQASTQRLSSALICRSPRTNVVVIVMEDCCSRQRVALFSASWAA